MNTPVATTATGNVMPASASKSAPAAIIWATR
jgi:hypothetical protein